LECILMILSLIIAAILFYIDSLTCYNTKLVLRPMRARGFASNRVIVIGCIISYLLVCLFATPIGINAAIKTWDIIQGGTGANNATDARTNLQAAKSGSNADIIQTTALTCITPSCGTNIESTCGILNLRSHNNCGTFSSITLACSGSYFQGLNDYGDAYQIIGCTSNKELSIKDYGGGTNISSSCGSSNSLIQVDPTIITSCAKCAIKMQSNCDNNYFYLLGPPCGCVGQLKTAGCLRITSGEGININSSNGCFNSGSFFCGGESAISSCHCRIEAVHVGSSGTSYFDITGPQIYLAANCGVGSLNLCFNNINLGSVCHPCQDLHIASNGATFGSATLVAGIATVTSSHVQAGTYVGLGAIEMGGTPGIITVTINPGVGFTFTSIIPGTIITNTSDTSTIPYWLVQN
jgi:hypothetical protein